MIGETTQLILDRMKSNPEEFFRSNSDRWYWLFDADVKTILTDEERDALQAGFDDIRKKEFHHRVLETILNADHHEREVPAQDLGLTKIRSANRYLFNKVVSDSTLGTIGPAKIIGVQGGQ